MFNFNDIWYRYPRRVARRAAERQFLASVLTDQDWADIQTALKNYLSSMRVYKGFVMNGATWFYNWRDWIDYTEPVCSKCKGEGKFINKITGYEIICNCKEIK